MKLLMKVAIITLAVFACSAVPLAAQETSSKVEHASVTIDAYYGGLPFYTAFHQHMTTRLSILKASCDSGVLADYLGVSESQRSTIAAKKIADKWALPDSIRENAANANLQIDEFQIDPDFFGFLDSEQRERLDRLAIEFDGYAGIVLVSIAKRVELPERTREAVRSKLAEYHESTWLPYFRYEFAARLPADHTYRRCVFVGQYALGINQTVLSALNEDEHQRLSNWLEKDPPPHEVTEAIRKLAPLPEGLFGLAKYYER